MIKSVLIANRGEIACRVIVTAQRLGIRTIAVYSDADRGARHVRMADEAVHIGPASPRESYLNMAAVLDAAQKTGAEAIHPGYGFLSENAEFAERVAAAGLIFVGPPPHAIRAMGLKDRAKSLMQAAGVPIVPGEFGDSQDIEFLTRRANEIGFPIMVKAVAGGGGKGMRRVDDPADFVSALEGAKREAKGAFGDDRMMLERYVLAPRHIEVQVFADTHGNVIHLFERDCSLQRRHQKVIEEAPAPGMTEEFRARITQAAVTAARAINYVGAGTVEFIADGANGLHPDRVYFLEMNTRLQVEHPVTESIVAEDLVEWQIRIASGEALPKAQADLSIHGHAMEARLYAEDPARGFLPSIGRLAYFQLGHKGSDIRIDAGVDQGDVVSVHYDPMIAKIIAHGPTRLDAAAKLAAALAASSVIGVETNARFLERLVRHPEFLEGRVETGFIDRHSTTLVPDRRDGLNEIATCLAVLALIRRREIESATNEPNSPWAVLDHFRLCNRGGETVALTQDENEIAIAVMRQHNGFVMTIHDRAFHVSGRLQADQLTAELEGHRFTVPVIVTPTSIALVYGGDSYRYDVPNVLEQKIEGTGHGAAITAPMPGRIIAIPTAIGSLVKRGAALVVMEAMKMEHTLTAPGDGILARVYVSVGDQVTDGALIAEIEPEEAPAAS
jgi:3-methylcrotonyl-CoA carboxylase alpha subunit